MLRLIAALLLSTPLMAAELGNPLVIAHRGASGELPEHTLEAYTRALEQGADCIEPDLVMTRDGHFIARHDTLLNLTTDVADKLAYISRRKTRKVSGQQLTGWFVEDFTLAEIQGLRATERIPQVRQGNAQFDGQFGIPSLADILALVQRFKQQHGRDVCLYPELKHPSYHASIGLPMEAQLVEALHGAGFDSAESPVFIQSFETDALRKLRKLTPLRLVQLLGAGKPWDIAKTGGVLSYRSMASREGLAVIAEYADGIGAEKYTFVMNRDTTDQLSLYNATELVEQAHALGLFVHVYTFRAENLFLPRNYRKGMVPANKGDAAGELHLFLNTGIDGFFTDYPAIGVAERDRYRQSRTNTPAH